MGPMKHTIIFCVLFCGCLAIPNPWFELDSMDSGEQPNTSSGGATSSVGTSSTPTSSGTTTGSSSTSVTTEMEAPTSSGPVPTSTTETSSESTSSESTSSESTSSTGSEGSSTGEPENLFGDLYELCPVPGVGWWGGAGSNVLLQCNDGDLPGVSQIPALQIDGMEETSILNISPSLEPLGAMEGRYPFAPLDPNQALTAKVLAKVHCPVSPDPMKPCSTNAKIEARVNDVPVGSSQTPLEDGASEALLLDLSVIPEILGGEGFEIVLRVDVGENPGPHDRVYFIHPRVTI